MDRGLVMLVAEDNPDDALFLDWVFQRMRLKVFLSLVTNGAEVIRFLKAEGQYDNREKFPFPNLLLIDLHMPIMTGF